jgi:hypothetical protein
MGGIGNLYICMARSIRVGGVCVGQQEAGDDGTLEQDITGRTDKVKSPALTDRYWLEWQPWKFLLPVC